MIFSGLPSESDGECEVLVEHLPLVLTGDKDRSPTVGLSRETVESSIDENPPESEGWKGSSEVRFVQFGFSESNFFVDLPRQTLDRAEAEQLLNRRLSFYYLDDKAEDGSDSQEVQAFAPFRKQYIYQDESTAAAEDMAFI